MACTADGWFVTEDFDVTSVAGVDPTRSLGRVTVRGGERLAVDDDQAVSVAAVLASAEAVGVASWCVETAAAHAKVREQFGRPIGQFQAVKHRCADMLVALELARAATWDAARELTPLTAAVAGALAPDAALRCANDCIQVLGGIGFTWEHDAHLYLKRALSVQALIGQPSWWRRRVAELAGEGQRRELRIDLGPEAEPHRAEVGEFIATLEKGRRRAQMAEAGYITPHWPAPWGRDASPIEQLVIDEEFSAANVRRPHLAVGAWALPTIINHGTTAQQERFILPTLRGEISWCQLFSEPGAGSDLAALSTKATRAENGWLLSGQKVWTSMAQDADWGICLARTDSDRPKHEGITCFLVDMKSAGVDVRPLRELTGASLFNEVFLSDVFVADECVVGDVNDGWRVGRTTLANERVSMGAGAGIGPSVDAVLQLVPDDADAVVLDQVGALVAESQALAVLGVRLTLRTLAGADAGPESSDPQAGRRRTRSAHPGARARAARRGRCRNRRRRRALDQRSALESLPNHRRRHQRDPTQRHRRTPPRPPAGPLKAKCRCPIVEKPRLDTDTLPYGELAAAEHVEQDVSHRRADGSHYAVDTEGSR